MRTGISIDADALIHRTQGVAERLDMGCVAQGINLIELGRRVGFTSPALIYRIKSGLAPIERYADALALALGCESAWLAQGNGPVPSWGHDRRAALFKRSAVERLRLRAIRHASAAVAAGCR